MIVLINLGRSDFYFNLDLETRKWVKDGFAY